MLFLMFPGSCRLANLDFVMKWVLLRYFPEKGLDCKRCGWSSSRRPASCGITYPTSQTEDYKTHGRGFLSLGCWKFGSNRNGTESLIRTRAIGVSTKHLRLLDKNEDNNMGMTIGEHWVLRRVRSSKTITCLRGVPASASQTVALVWNAILEYSWDLGAIEIRYQGMYRVHSDWNIEE